MNGARGSGVATASDWLSLAFDSHVNSHVPVARPRAPHGGTATLAVDAVGPSRKYRLKAT